MFKRGLLALAALTLIACGGEELGPEDAQVAWSSTQTALNGGTDSGGPNALLGTTFTYDCKDGGKAKFSYDLGNTLSGFDTDGGSSVSVTYEVKFKGCTVDGVKIKGLLAFSIASETSADGSFTEWTYDGDLTYKGDIKGTCLIDMKGRIGATTDSVGFSYEGSICGNDASATLNVDSDGVSNNVDGETVDSTDPATM